VLGVVAFVIVFITERFKLFAPGEPDAS